MADSDQQINKLIYLAIPYTWNPNVSFNIANQVSAMLMENCDYVVFSPISHSHPISEYLVENDNLSADFWLKQDLMVLEKCEELHIIRINGNFGQKLIDESYGCKREIIRAQELNIPIKYQDYNCKL